MRNWYRSPIMLMSELVQYIFISLFVGLMYHKLGDEVPNGVYDRAACIWFSFAVMSFTPSYTAVTSWDKERLLLKRELQQRQYNVTSFYIARQLVTVPFECLQTVVFVAVMYFFVGFQAEASKFFLFILILIMFQLVSEGLGLLCAILTRQATYAIITLTFLLLLLLSFSGFLISKIPPYFIPINKASYLTYAYAALMRSELDGLMLYDPQSSSMVDAWDHVPSILDNGLSIGQNLGVLASIVVGMELLKVAALNIVYKLDMM